MPSHRTIVRRIQRQRVLVHIPNLLSTSVLNVPEDVKTTNRGKYFYTNDSGEEDPNRFIFLQHHEAMRQKTSIAAEGWHHAIEGSSGHVDTTSFKFDDLL